MINLTKHTHIGGLTMLKNESKQISFYSTIYNKIPENHILKLINNTVDFSFINNLIDEGNVKMLQFF